MNPDKDRGTVVLACALINLPGDNDVQEQTVLVFGWPCRHVGRAGGTLRAGPEHRAILND